MMEKSMSRYGIYLASALISSLFCCCSYCGGPVVEASSIKVTITILLGCEVKGGLVYMIKAKSFTYGGLYCLYVIFNDKDDDDNENDETLNGNA